MTNQHLSLTLKKKVLLSVPSQCYSIHHSFGYDGDRKIAVTVVVAVVVVVVIVVVVVVVVGGVVGCCCCC